MASPVASSVVGRRRARNGLCSAPDAPRVLEIATRPGRSGPLDDVRLARPRPGQGDHRPVAIGQVEDRLIAVSRASGTGRGPDRGAPGDHRPAGEDRPPQVDLEAGRLVGQRDGQGVGLVAVST